MLLKFQLSCISIWFRFIYFYIHNFPLTTFSMSWNLCTRIMFFKSSLEIICSTNIYLFGYWMSEYIQTVHTLQYKPKSGAGKPYSEVTAAFLQSSLGISHSFALVYSTWPPVSVYGTDLMWLCLENFLGSALCIIPFDESPGLNTAWIPHLREHADLPTRHSDSIYSNPIMSNTYCTPSFHRITRKFWNINQMSIGCGFRHCLRPD